MFKFFERIFDPFTETEILGLPDKFLAFIWKCTRGVRAKLLVMAIITAIASMIEVCVIAMIGKIVDWPGAHKTGRSWSELNEAFFTVFLLMLIGLFLVGTQTLIKHQCLTMNFPMRLRWDFHRRLLRQGVGFHQNELSGRLVTKVLQTSESVRDALFVVSDVMVAMWVYVATMIVTISMFDARLILPFVSWVVLYGSAMFYFVPRLARSGQALADARSRVAGRMTDAYANIVTIKLFSHSRTEAEYARESMRDLLHAGHSEMRLVSTFDIVNHIISVVLVVGTIGIALWLWSVDAVGLGAISAGAAMALRLQSTSHWFMWELTSLFENIGIIRDGIKTLSLPLTVADVHNATELSVTHGAITFEGLKFVYPATEDAVLEGFDLDIKPGEKIGLIGRSGAGKSTVLNLLMRFYDLTNGRILIDGQDIAAVTQDSLRKNIGFVTQDSSLLHRSIADNISYGNPEASQSEIKDVSQKAAAHDFIERLSGGGRYCGYDSPVGERGLKLSGGQRQRISIARTILKDAPILLLDEATSALDSEIEVLVQQRLYQAMAGKTVIAIAHRLSTIAAMDRLIVLDQGHIVEQGDHAGLLALGGLYAKLWAHQSGGFLGSQQ